MVRAGENSQRKRERKALAGWRSDRYSGRTRERGDRHRATKEADAMTTNGQTSGTNEKQGGVAGGGVVDRRDFLRSAAAAGVGVGLFGGAGGLLSESGVARAAWAGGSDTL